VKEECPVNLDLPDQEEKTDLKDLMENQDHQDLRDLLDTKDLPDWLVCLVSEVFLDHQDLRDLLDTKDLPDQLVLMAGQGNEVSKELLVLQDPLVRLVALEIQDRLDLLENRALLV